MISNDEIVTINTLTLILDKHFAETKEQLALTRQENAEFRVQIQNDLNNFKDEIRTDLSKIHSEIGVLQRDVEGLKHDVIGLYHWDYWLLSIILIVFVMPQFITGVQSLFKAIADGIGTLRSAFKGKN